MSEQAPTRANRKQCWDARDAYYACLLKHDIIAPPGTDMSDVKGPLATGKFADATDAQTRQKKLEEARANDPCAKLRDTYEGSCLPSWVEYFNKRRILEERQKVFYADAAARVR
ncbi:hypothetical protein MCUN1_000462 [Malassezia cuniculi]|uniref:Cytochrome c oxidase subunit 6B-like protein new16 n=1 Tax=Malassezia cuniculi TaxID=948313 RepID=A0AAF0ERD1_9BASI|nr:hypothetical protein MCUN1_000462 [Malassezia cuniculi]